MILVEGWSNAMHAVGSTSGTPKYHVSMLGRTDGWSAARVLDSSFFVLKNKRKNHELGQK